jgi:hypothetical protein
VLAVALAVTSLATFALGRSARPTPRDAAAAYARALHAASDRSRRLSYRRAWLRGRSDGVAFGRASGRREGAMRGSAAARRGSRPARVDGVP